MYNSMHYVVVFLFFVFFTPFDFAEDIVPTTVQSNDNVSPEKMANKFVEQTFGFKQLSNNEMWERHLSVIMKEGINHSPQELHDIKQKFLVSYQGFYDEFLKMLLWNRYTELEKWDNLDMSGLKQLQWEIETNKQTYKVSEPIGIRLSIKNTSSENVVVLNTALQTGFMLNSIKLERRWGKNKMLSHLTERGYRIYPFVGYVGYAGTYETSQLRPSDKVPTNQSIKVLNSYYDLSEPGEYELTFYTRNYLGDDEHQIGEYPKPCTIRFTIEQKFYEPEIKWPDDETVIE